MTLPTRLMIGAFCAILLVNSAMCLADVKPPQQLAHFDEMGKPVVFPDGTIALYFIPIRGPGLAPTPAVQDLKCRKSTDNGHTWSEPESLFTFPEKDGGFGFFDSLVDQQGEVHIFMLCDANTGIIKESKNGRPAPARDQHLDIWHMRSTDQRTKWLAPECIWKGRGGDLQSVTQLRSGRLLLPICYETERNWSNRGEGFDAFDYRGMFDCTAIYSDDNGKTWTQSKSILKTTTPTNDSTGPVEPIVIQLNDGRVWMLIRTQNGRFYESFSADGSEWSPPQPTDILSSDSPAGLVRLADKRLVMMWNNCQRYPYAQGSREVLHAAISDDDGKTWHGRREILRNPYRKDPPPARGDNGVAYPYPVLAHDGRIVYTMWVETGQGRTVESFDPQWLLETHDSDDFANGLDRWSVFGCKGVEVTSQEGSADGKVLSLQKIDTEWPSAAVWNFPSCASGSLKLRVMAQQPFSGATLMLSDHFSSPFDTQDVYFSAYRLPLKVKDASSEEVALPTDRWVDLELRWNGSKRQCEVLLDGKVTTTLPQLHESVGPSYLRIRCNAQQPEKGRLLIDSVDMNAADNAAAK